jgi:hypothetical protein
MKSTHLYFLAQPEVGEEFLHFIPFPVGQAFHLRVFAFQLGRIMILFGFAGKITAQPHRNRTRGDFGQTGDPDQVQVILPHGPTETGSQRKRDR